MPWAASFWTSAALYGANDGAFRMICGRSPPGTLRTTFVVSGDTALKSAPRIPPRLWPTYPILPRSNATEPAAPAAALACAARLFGVVLLTTRTSCARSMTCCRKLSRVEK
jgi:hypothetical protein